MTMLYTATAESREEKMELVLTQLRNFSSKSATFNDCTSAEIPPNGYRRAEDGEKRQKLDIESALAWLRKELMEMRFLDQMLIKQLMELHAGIQELKLEYNDLNDTDSEYDSDSICSSFREGCLNPLFSTSTLHQVSARRAFFRRSSMP
nr:PREDICTED: protein FAM167A-like [Latimeria chalumnae]|eukprot:XP_005994570.1 PREDICTED: protein FAM167A-like [Latimeria chalumnae]